MISFFSSPFLKAGRSFFSLPNDFFATLRRQASLSLNSNWVTLEMAPFSGFRFQKNILIPLPAFAGFFHSWSPSGPNLASPDLLIDLGTSFLGRKGPFRPGLFVFYRCTCLTFPPFPCRFMIH